MRRTKEETLQTRKNILEAAVQVFFDQGIARTTLEDIARAAGVTRGAIYWHFQNKADLINAVHAEVNLPMEEVLYRILEAPGEGALQRLEEHCVSTFAGLQKDEHSRRVYTILLLKCEYSEEMSGLIERLRESKQKIIESLARFLLKLKEVGQLSDAIDPPLAALGLYAYMVGLYNDYLRYPEHYVRPGYAKKLIGHYFAPLYRAAAHS